MNFTFFADFRALLYCMWWHLTLTSFFSGKIGPLLWWLWWGETLLQQQQQASIQRHRVVREEHRENLQQNGLDPTTATRTTTGFDGFLRGHAEAIHNILVLHQLDFDAGIPLSSEQHFVAESTAVQSCWPFGIFRWTKIPTTSSTYYSLWPPRPLLHGLLALLNNEIKHSFCREYRGRHTPLTWSF